MMTKTGCLLYQRLVYIGPGFERSALGLEHSGEAGWAGQGRQSCTLVLYGRGSSFDP